MRVDQAPGYIEAVRWQYAKTMPDWPHEYTIKSWRPELAEQFEAFCRLILEAGLVEPWPLPPANATYHNHYLVIDDHKYWAMGPLGDRDPIEHKTVINREALASPTVTPEVSLLGRDASCRQPTYPHREP